MFWEANLPRVAACSDAPEAGGGAGHMLPASSPRALLSVSMEAVAGTAHLRQTEDVAEALVSGGCGASRLPLRHHVLQLPQVAGTLPCAAEEALSLPPACPPAPLVAACSEPPLQAASQASAAEQHCQRFVLNVTRAAIGWIDGSRATPTFPSKAPFTS